MLETIREYAAERLAENGEADAVGRAHAAHYLALAEAAERGLHGAGQTTWLARLARERDNLRAALAWAVAQREAGLALRLTTAAYVYWLFIGQTAEGRRWLGSPTTATSSGLPSTRWAVWPSTTAIWNRRRRCMRKV